MGVDPGDCPAGVCGLPVRLKIENTLKFILWILMESSLFCWLASEVPGAFVGRSWGVSCGGSEALAILAASRAERI